MPLIKLPGPQDPDNVFSGSPFAETFSEFLLGQGVGGVDPDNLTGQADAFKRTFTADPTTTPQGQPSILETRLSGGEINQDKRFGQTRDFIKNKELEGLLRGVSQRAGNAPHFMDILSLNPGQVGMKRDFGGVGQRRTQQARQQGFDDLFEAGIGEFSSRLRGTRGTPAQFQQKGGRRTGREDFR